MIWIRRRYPTETWAATPLFSQFEQHFMRLGAPPEMLMVEEQHDKPLDATIWIRLQDKSHAAAYPGFEETPPDLLPAEAVLLIGHNTEFEKLFKYARRRGRGA